MKYNKNIEWEINEDLLPPASEHTETKDEVSPIIKLLQLSIFILLPIICLSKIF